jgi:hypothetical protein
VERRVKAPKAKGRSALTKVRLTATSQSITTSVATGAVPEKRTNR